MKIYISGKISGLEEQEYKMNFEQSILASGLLFPQILIKHYIDVFINPLDIKPFLGIKSWLCYMITDLYKLSKCSHIAMQKNWIDSRGAVIEYYFARFIFKLKIIWL